MTKPMVTLLESSIVVPSTPTERQHLYLSSLDLFWRDIHYNLRLVFYKIGSDDYPAFVRTLKESLSAVLVHFFPLAGRLGKGDDGRIVIDCNDAGVEFLQASIDASFEDMGENFDFKPFFAELAQWGHLRRSDSFEVPLLSVQVTRFVDGGVAVGVSHSHVAMDGNSLWHFMVSWGECARGVPISKPPIHDRTAFKPDEISEETAKLLPFSLVPFPTTETRVLVHKVFHVSYETLERLKKMAVPMPGHPHRVPSAYMALCAHFWRHVTLARQVPPDTNLSFVVLANWRWPRHTSPSPQLVSDAYFGNAITWTNAYTTARELLSEDFPATVSRIMDVVDSCTSIDTLYGTIHWLELHDTRLRLDTHWFPGTTMNVASSNRFPVYEVNFGWGTPSCVRPMRAGADGEICLYPARTKGDRGIDVCIKLDPLVMARLQEDPLFLPSS